MGVPPAGDDHVTGRPERGTLHGRRKGRPLRAGRAGLLADRLPDLRLVPDDVAGDPQSLFPVPVDALRMEIGFGAGEHLRAEAAANPGTGFIGVEPFLNGLARMVAGLEEAGLRNVRLYDGDAAELLDRLPPASLARADLLYPDPWPKRRHWKRRFVSEANLDRLARTIAPGGEFRVASDIPGYIDWTLGLMLARPDFLWTATRADDWRKPWAGWPGTRYEGKALAAGRVPAYLTFVRQPA